MLGHRLSAAQDGAYQPIAVEAMAIKILLLLMATGSTGAAPAMWPTPSDPVQLDGLGGGIAWAEDASLCASLLKRFDAETLEYFGMRIFSFVSCEEITDSLLRAFSTWSANHAYQLLAELLGIQSHECLLDAEVISLLMPHHMENHWK